MPGHPTARFSEAALGHTRGSGSGGGLAEAAEGTRGLGSEARAEGTPRELCSADLVFRPGPQTKVTHALLVNGPTPLFFIAILLPVAASTAAMSGYVVWTASS